jgi:hypothetical protein
MDKYNINRETYIDEVFKAIYIFKISDTYINNACTLEMTGNNRKPSEITPINEKLRNMINKSNDTKLLKKEEEILKQQKTLKNNEDNNPNYDQFVNDILNHNNDDS